MIVSAQGITKRFGDFTAVNDVSFHIEGGECLGLLGPNGAGKSTLISMLYGAMPRTAGKLQVLGGDPAVNGRDIKRRMGVVTQENALDESMSVEENMLMFASFMGVPREERQKRVTALLDFMSLNHKRDEEIKALSGGMQRRLVFVRALLGKPEFLILDEPTTGLDPAVRHLLWSKVQELKAQGVTILLTTHYMDEAEILCDRLLIMDKGAFAAQGHPQQLIRDLAPGYVAHFPQDQSSEARARDLCVSYRHFSLQHHSTGFTLRAPQFGELSQAVNAAGLEPKMIRPANLEDVFLKISGRELADNA